MYCFVRYITYEDFQKIRHLNRFENVPFVENKSLIINPNCFIGIIMDHIFTSAGIEYDIRTYFDLATEKGKLLNISNYPPDTNGILILAKKVTYYLVYIKDEEIRPLLNKTSTEILDFSVFMRSRSAQGKRRSKIISRSTKSGSVISTDLKFRYNPPQNPNN